MPWYVFFAFKRDNDHVIERQSTEAKSTPFTVNKDEWDTKEDTGKSMKNALHVLQYAERHVSG